jgi:hypothetical protein
MKKNLFLAVLMLALLFLPSISEAVPPMPYRIGGTVSVEGTALTSTTDTGYTFKVTKEDGTTDYISASGAKAEDTDGLSTTGWYVIDVPMYNADQTGGANEGDIAVMHAYKDGNELVVTDPVDGEFTIPAGAAGTTKQINLVINLPPVANAGPDQTIDEDATVTLDGSGSTDGQGIASYMWTQTAGTPTVTLTNPNTATPTFTAPDVGTTGASLTFQLTVTDTGGLTGSNTTVVNVSWVNAAPTANAGIDQNVNEGITVTLDGSNSSDPDDGISSYSWIQTAGTPVTLSNANTAKPTFTSPDVGTGGTSLTFQLTVTDKGGLQDTDDCIVNISWINVAPTASAGADQTVDEGITVTLDGSNSSDPDDGISSYSWIQTAGTSVTLSDATAAKPTFTSPDVGTQGEALTFQLTVTDNGGLQGTDTVIVNVSWINAAPTAHAGIDQNTSAGATVTLDGSNSSDPDDGIASYLWAQTAGTSVTLSSATAVKPTFTAPDVETGGSISLTFQLTVTDNGGLQDTDTCIVNVSWQNIAPTANAGADQTVDEGVTVTLDGSGSSDPDDGIASYLWAQTAGTSVTLSSTTVAQPTFTAPDVGIEGESFTFQLTVTDVGGLQATDTCIVNVSWVNVAPTANAGADQTAEEGSTVTLDGSGSDPDDGIGTYQWVQTDGNSVTLSSATDAKPTFVAGPVTESTVFSFELTVTDNGGLQATDGVAITVNDNGITDYADIPNAMTFKSYNEEDFAGTIASGGACVYLEPVDPATITDQTNRPSELPYGLWDIAFKTDTVGGTVNVTIYLPEAAESDQSWYKYSPTDGWYKVDNAVFNQDRKQVTLTLTDGGAGDDDGAADGMIMDPSGLGSTYIPPTPIPSVSDDDDNCFIATAAYGSPMERHVKILREFRDRFLVTNPVGEAFVDIYYRYSPTVADFIADNEALRASVRYCLLPFVGASWVALQIGILPIVIIAFFFIMGIVSGITRLRRKPPISVGG